MLIRSSALFLIALIPSVAFCQPAPVAPPKPPGYDCVDMDGVGGLSPNDFMAFQNAYVARSAYDQAVTLQTPPAQPSGLTATVAGTIVTLKWTNPPQPWTAGYVVRGTTVIPFTVNTTQVTDSPGPGSWTYSCTVRNIVTAGSYPGTFAPTGNPPAASATVQGTQPPPGTGWTTFVQDAGSRIVYVSSAGTGSACTQAAPCALATGLTQLRSGTTDWLLLKAGDTFPVSQTISLNVGSGVTGKYTLISTWGTGARPKIVSSIPANGGDTSIFFASGRRGIAIEGLDFSSTSGQIQQNAFQCLNCQDWLWENCCFHNIHRGIAFQGGGGRGARVTVRRCVGYEITSNGCNNTNCPQFSYFDLTDEWLFEQNFWDDCAIANSQYSRFCYFQDNCGPGVFQGNVSGRSKGDGSTQVRAGGKVVNNLSMRNAIGLYIGNSGSVVNEVAYNCVLESADIGPGQERGRGLHFNGQTNCHHNIVYQNRGTGWGSVAGIYADGASGTIDDNWAFEWSRDPAQGGPGDPTEARSFQISGNVSTSRNRVFLSRQGIVCEGGSGGTGNTYWEPAGGTYQTFRDSATKAGWVPLSAMPADPGLRALLPGGSIDAYAALIRSQSKATWRDDLLASEVNKKLRAAVGVAEPANP